MNELTIPQKMNAVVSKVLTQNQIEGLQESKGA